ncbi:hypothetical protein AGMMS49593_02060 [Endomicrobiia bacterium]|nr:hypothetical protein AGMMS49593_02060 [Endomicrobiia bacterium]GHT44572.1 hypothetical protein AGMMS49936_00110 [Endomicrobiia bacterium]
MVYTLVAVAACFAILFSIPLFMSNDSVLIIVQKGDSVLVVASRLKENKLICSKKLFLGLVKITKSENKLKAGTYNFSKKDGILKILKTLKCDSQNALKFTMQYKAGGSNYR